MGMGMEQFMNVGKLRVLIPYNCVLYFIPHYSFFFYYTHFLFRNFRMCSLIRLLLYLVAY